MRPAGRLYHCRWHGIHQGCAGRRIASLIAGGLRNGRRPCAEVGRGFNHIGALEGGAHRPGHRVGARVQAGVGGVLVWAGSAADLTGVLAGEV